MHPDLAPHLHTEECNQLIAALHQCHQQHPLAKFYGKCNREDTLMGHCLDKEREMKRQQNRQKKPKEQSELSKEFQKRLQQK